MGFCIVIFILWAIYHFWKLRTIFKKYEFLRDLKLPVNNSTIPFIRDDYNRWNFVKFYLVGLFLMPIRMLFIVVPLPFLYLSVRILKWFYGMKTFEGPLNPKFLHYCGKVMTMTVRSMAFGFGYWKVNKIKRDPKPENLGYFKREKEQRLATLVANHSTFMDMIIMLAREVPVCFIANHHMKNYLLIGYISQAIQCVFLNRQDKESRGKIMEFLKNRAQSSKENPKSDFLFMFCFC